MVQYLGIEITTLGCVSAPNRTKRWHHARQNSRAWRTPDWLEIRTERDDSRKMPKERSVTTPIKLQTDRRRSQFEHPASAEQEGEHVAFNDLFPHIWNLTKR
jgi:hypothetical protein